MRVVTAFASAFGIGANDVVSKQLLSRSDLHELRFIDLRLDAAGQQPPTPLTVLFVILTGELLCNECCQQSPYFVSGRSA